MYSPEQESPTSLAIVSRVLASVLGGYAFCWGFVTLGIVLLLLAGVPYGEAQIALYLLAFLVFLVAFLWSFAATNLVRVWAVLAGGGVAMTALALFMSRSVLQ